MQQLLPTSPCLSSIQLKGERPMSQLLKNV